MNEEEVKAWVGSEYRVLTDPEKWEITRGRKTLKTNGKSEYVYIDIDGVPSAMHRRIGSNYTPPKKKRKR